VSTRLQLTNISVSSCQQTIRSSSIVQPVPYHQIDCPPINIKVKRILHEKLVAL
jgi:hypothetical protein